MTLSKRKFGRTGWDVSAIGFGAWAIGGSWGGVAEDDAKAALNAALDSGVNFIDTADVYGDGRSKRIIRDVLRQRGGERPIVATKLGRRLDPHVTSGYTNRRELAGFIDRSLSNLGVANRTSAALPSAVSGRKAIAYRMLYQLCGHNVGTKTGVPDE